MTETCSRCGKNFDTENCEAYADIQYEIYHYHVSKHSGRIGKYTLCGDCEDHFNIFMHDALEERMENGQTSQS